MHVVCEWIGNSQAVAAKHYLQTTDEHFEQAANEATGTLQKAVQQPDGEDRNEAQKASRKGENSPECASLRYCTSVSVTPTGLEPVLPA